MEVNGYIDKTRVLNGAKCEKCSKVELLSSVHRDKLKDKGNDFTCLSCYNKMTLNFDEIIGWPWTC